MAGGGSSKSRKRVEATPAAAATTGPSLVRAKDGSAFARWCVLVSFFIYFFFFFAYMFILSCIDWLRTKEDILRLWISGIFFLLSFLRLIHRRHCDILSNTPFL